MKKEKVWLILFCILLPLFLLLFSYKTVSYFSLDEEQQESIEGISSLEYTSAELSHMQDVSKVMRGADFVFYGLLLILTLILTYYRKDIKQTKKLLKYGGLTTIIFVLVVLLFSLTSFDYLFTLFHQFFFPQGNWTFESSSLLLQTFPIEFFISISRNIFLGTLLLGIVFYTLTSFLKK